MLDPQAIREDTDRVRKALASRNDPSLLELLDRVVKLDQDRRRLQTAQDERRARLNLLSRQIGELISKGTPASDVEQRRQDAHGESNLIQSAGKDLERADAELRDLLLQLPNLPLVDVPPGLASENNVVRTGGELRTFDFAPLPHWELGERLGIIDFQRGVKLSGSRFFVLKGAGAKLERALISWMLDLHVQEHGYQEVYPPFLVKGEALYGSGNLPKFGENLYHDAEEDLWLVPTAEVPLTNMHRDEILEPGTLPISYVAYTPCFRREKAAAGKDTRGIKRVHQFDKVEMYKFVEPEKSNEELPRLVADAENVCQRLGLPYRVVELCTEDLGFASAKSFDLEVWAPGCGEWLEVSTCSNCTDFQARRANVRYRPSPRARPEFVHTLNGSGLALPRVVIALLESYQQQDGSVLIPKELQEYTGFEVIKGPS